jgi:hypothetical protein
MKSKNSFVGQEIPQYLWIPKVQNNVCKSQSVDSWANLIKSTSLSSIYFNIHLNIILTSTLGLPSWLFPSDVPQRATCPAHLTLHFMEVTIHGKE